MKDGGIYAFVELHIEQGPVLEKAREELGVVTAIAAVSAPAATPADKQWRGRQFHELHVLNTVVVFL